MRIAAPAAPAVSDSVVVTAPAVPEIKPAGVIDNAPGAETDADLLRDLGAYEDEGEEGESGTGETSGGDPDADGASDADGDSGADGDSPAAAEGGFDQAAFDARMAELSAVPPAPADAASEPSGPSEAAPGQVAEFRAKLGELKVDPASFQYDGERTMAEKQNAMIDALGDSLEPLFARFDQVEAMYIRQVAQGVATQLQEGAQLVAKTYGISIAPEQMDSLLRRNTDLAQKAGGFTAQVVMEAFERENWKSLMAMQATKKEANQKPAPKTLPAQGGTDRMHRQGQKLTDDELIMRDLA